MMKNYIFLLFIGLNLWVSCSDNQENNETENTKTTSEKVPDFEMKFHEDKEGKKAEVNMFVSLRYSLFNEEGDTLATTYSQGKPFEVLLEPMGEDDLLIKLLTQMSVGDSASYFTNAETYYKSENMKMPDSIDLNNRYEFRVKLEKIQTPAQKATARREEENKVLLAYMHHNFPTGMRDEVSGLYIFYEKKGTGRPASIGDSVKFKYTTKQLDDKILDSSGEKEVGLILGQKNIIEGWKLAFTKYMNKGTKATILLPSHLAFGHKQKLLKYKNQMTNLGPFTVLKCELELTNIYRRKK